VALPLDNIVLYWTASICDASTGLGCLYLLVAAACVLRFPEHHPAPGGRSSPVTILKPLHGAEPGLDDRLRRFCSQHYAASIQMVCGIADEKDTAAKSVGELIAQEGEADIKLVIDGRQRGSNRKVSNLANMLAHARHEVLVLADSDIEVGPDYLAEVTKQLDQEHIGAVTCLYHGVSGPGLWSRHAALAINSNFLPSIIVALTFRLAEPCFGSTIALRRSTLSHIGGFEAFADSLADDYAIGAAIRSAGYRVAIPATSVGHFCHENSLRSLLMHEIRVARTIRSLRPLSYCGTILTHPLPFALLAAACSDPSPLLLAALAIASRALLCRCVEHRFTIAPQPYWLIPFNDILSFATFLISFVNTRVAWRGMAYRITPDGHLLTDRDGLP
jgi:ceramide glucosyltransferase